MMLKKLSVARWTVLFVGLSQLHHYLQLLRRSCENTQFWNMGVQVCGSDPCESLHLQIKLIWPWAMSSTTFGKLMQTSCNLTIINDIYWPTHCRKWHFTYLEEDRITLSGNQSGIVLGKLNKGSLSLRNTTELFKVNWCKMKPKRFQLLVKV